MNRPPDKRDDEFTLRLHKRSVLLGVSIAVVIIMAHKDPALFAALLRLLFPKF